MLPVSALAGVFAPLRCHAGCRKLLPALQQLADSLARHFHATTGVVAWSDTCSGSSRRSTPVLSSSGTRDLSSHLPSNYASCVVHDGPSSLCSHALSSSSSSHARGVSGRLAAAWFAARGPHLAFGTFHLCGRTTLSKAMAYSSRAYGSGSPSAADDGTAAQGLPAAEHGKQKPIRFLFRSGKLHPVYAQGDEDDAAQGQPQAGSPAGARRAAGGSSQAPLSPASAAPGEQLEEFGDDDALEEYKEANQLAPDDVGHVFNLPQPHERLQPQLSGPLLSEARQEANRRTRLHTLVSVRVGKRSLTQPFVWRCGSLLEQHEYLRVRIAPQSGLQRGFVEFALCTLLDCVCVFRRGGTLVLHRDCSIPRPSSSLPAEGRAGVE